MTAGEYLPGRKHLRTRMTIRKDWQRSCACWESLGAGPAMVAWMEEHAPPGYLHRQGITAKRICELAQQGDELAAQAVEHEGYYLGLGLANLISLFTPDAIVLSGSVMKS